MNDSLPNRRHHGFKFLEIGPDNKIYLPVGAPCNVCEEDPIFATILNMNLKARYAVFELGTNNFGEIKKIVKDDFRNS